MPQITVDQLTQSIGAQVEQNVPLAQFSTFKLGGPAEFLVRAKSAEIIKQAIQTALDNNLPYTILGGGANVLIADKGIKGLVIKTENTDVAVEGEIIRAQAGAPLAQIAVKSSQAGLAGLEFAVAIPGSVGGGVRGNAGCYGTELKDVLTRVHVLQIVILEGAKRPIGSSISKMDSIASAPQSGASLQNDKRVEDVWLENKDCHFAYRESRFKREPFVILEAEFKAMPGNKEESMAKMSKWLEQKKATQSVESNCAGCVFKNVAWPDWEKVSPEALKKEDVDSGKEFQAKGIVPAGWIIDQLGLKGFRLGGTMVSEKHGNFLLNMGQGSTDQMVQLISYVKMQVRDRLGVMLQEEVQYLGF